LLFKYEKKKFFILNIRENVLQQTYDFFRDCALLLLSKIMMSIIDEKLFESKLKVIENFQLFAVVDAEISSSYT
jgi:hypothetical protein